MQVLTGILLLCGLPTASSKKVVSFSIGKKAPRALTLGYTKRDLLSASLANLQNQYHISLSIGNPPQDASVAIDTGSADLWLMEPNNPYCEGASGSNVPYSYQVECSDGSFFDTAASSSWSDNSTEFSILYGDGSVALGSYGQDDLSINGVKISKANFAVANMSNSTDGVFGIGPRYQEANVSRYTSNGVAIGTYDNIPIQMKQQGLISSNAYSLYLDHIDEDAGTLLFGGVDHSKYKGSLGVVPVLPYNISRYVELQEPAMLNVMFNGLGVQDKSGNKQWLAECAFPVLLDSGATLSYLPGAIIRPAALAVGATYSLSADGYVLRCNTAGSLLLNFSGVEVEVALENSVVPLYTTNEAPYKDQDGNELCLLGLIEQYTGVYLSETYILGDSILRGLYVVYDLENWEVGIATADLDAEDEDIEEITDRIPRGSSAPSYSSTSAKSTYSAAIVSATSGAPGFYGDTGGASRRGATPWLAGLLMLLL